ncbi:collagen alpha-1(I) chain-like [Heterocephalus glaber]|uniref:Collagen alpha-1(I) chain-like n=1 Tax=Heterocephalus glaber TaxID=10181 RepID=A0AAX6SDC6_HETGA|nr:collagen alpha-1(I) chain-like [Heterocephalus glaber]
MRYALGPGRGAGTGGSWAAQSDICSPAGRALPVRHRKKRRLRGGGLAGRGPLLPPQRLGVAAPRPRGPQSPDRARPGPRGLRPFSLDGSAPGVQPGGAGWGQRRLSRGGRHDPACRAQRSGTWVCARVRRRGVTPCNAPVYTFPLHRTPERLPPGVRREGSPGGRRSGAAAAAGGGGGPWSDMLERPEKGRGRRGPAGVKAGAGGDGVGEGQASGPRSAPAPPAGRDAGRRERPPMPL